jgi:hypothetical protein
MIREVGESGIAANFPNAYRQSMVIFAAIPLSLYRKIDPCHCERSEAIPLHKVKLVI